MTDNVVLVGLPGSGKSKVGRAVAHRLGRPFVDLDAEFHTTHGHTPAQHIERYGEASFRALEAQLARTARSGCVIATGGGAVIDPLTRWELWHSGLVVWLDAPDHVLLDRLAHSATPRPLAGNREALAALRTQRTRFYAAADLKLDATATLDDKITAIRAALESGVPAARTLYRAQVRRDHPMGPRTATILMGHGFDTAALTALVAEHSAGAPVVVVDRNVAAAQPDLTTAFGAERQLVIDAGEQNKRPGAAEAMCEFAAQQRAERKDAWVALGGGTTGDLAGFAAAIYLRGAPLIQVPTTLLAMSDSAIGGKVGADLAAGKNLVGAFWPPVAVVADTAALTTLTRPQLLDGLAECIKSAIIGDAWLWDLIVARAHGAVDGKDPAALYAIAERSAALKIGVVDRDPFEDGERKNLNLGHTIGHALELESGFQLTHGAGVVLGMRAVTALAVSRGIADPELASSLDSLLQQLGYAMTRRFDPVRVREALTRDKKVSAGTLTWILPTAIGHVTQVRDVTPAEIDAALAVIQED